MENQNFCQSCSMPLGTEDALLGTEVDGSKNADYCSYCYKEGAFTSDMSMKDMIELCVPYMATAESGMTEDAARQMMNQSFPSLKRWKS